MSRALRQPWPLDWGLLVWGPPKPLPKSFPDQTWTERLRVGDGEKKAVDLASMSHPRARYRSQIGRNRKRDIGRRRQARLGRKSAVDVHSHVLAVPVLRKQSFANGGFGS